MIASDQRDCYSCRIEYSHIDLSSPQGFDPFPQVAGSLDRAPGDAQRMRQQELSGVSHHYPVDQLILIFTVRCPACVFRHECCILFTEREQSKSFGDCFPAAGVFDHCIAGAVVDLYPLHSADSSHVVFQDVRLSEAHPVDIRMDPYPSSDIRADIKSHMFSPISQPS